MIIKMLKDEYWWGGSINLGHEMPYTTDSDCYFDLNGGRENDQFAPLLVSNKGRYIWSEESFKAEIKNGEIKLDGKGEFELRDGYENLKGAYMAAMNDHFKFTGEMPNELFWRAPQYNTWIELGTDQTTEKILAYANQIIENGLVPGVLMIDDGWQAEFGVFEFNKRKVSDPKFLIDELHKLGFKVMLWVSPTVASAGTDYKKLLKAGYLIMTKDGEPAIRKWWNGYSAVLDLTNPEAEKWYHSQLSSLMERYGVDGFKFDAGDYYFYSDDDVVYTPMPARNHARVFNEIGEKYSFNEFRAAWKFGGRAIVSRLHDKYHSWDDFGINTLIPHTILQGLCGYTYCCPDMVGGGVLDCFNKGQKLDEELFVRWAQANALMPMMQMSIATWRVLNEENSKLVLDAVNLHTKFADKFYELAKISAKTGEPIVKHMSYVYPDKGYETVGDQFMLGDDMLVAPVLLKGATSRKVILPSGQWQDEKGNIHNGDSVIEVAVTIESIPYFTRK